MNHHDTPHPTPTALCARVAPLLPALDEWGELSVLTLAGDAPSSDELALTHAHLATCAYCQAQRAAYARLDVALHGAVGMRAIAPLRTADIMAGLLHSQPNTLPISAEMGAEMGAEIAPTPTIASATIATMIAARVVLAEAPARAPSGASLPAAPPSARSGRALALRKRWAPVWLATVAAALVVALLAAGIVRSVGVRVGSGLVGSTASPTSVTSAYSSGLFNGQGPALTNITMVSPTEGWAFGPSQPGQSPLMYHLLDNAWTPASLSSAAGTLDISTPTALSFYSPTDGLAFFASFLGSEKGHYISVLHYDGRSWRLISRGALDTATTYCEVSAFQMVSPTEGWGVCAGPTMDNQLLLHYVNQSWSTVALPAGLNTTLDGNHTIISNTATWLTDLSMQSATQGWAVGYVAGTGANPDQLYIGFILQYKDGQWSVNARYGDEELRSVSALASGGVWAAGEKPIYDCSMIAGQSPFCGSSANPFVQRSSEPVMLRYRQGQWMSVTIKVNERNLSQYAETLTQVVMRSPTDGWALGSEIRQSQTKSGAQVISTSLVLLHYDGVRWQPMTTGLPPAPAITRYTILGLGVSSNGDCWAVGQIQQGQGNHVTNSPLIQRYHDGRWNYIYTIVLK